MAECGVAGVPALVLASTSPRRKSILQQFGLDPIVVPVDVDETPKPGENAPDLVDRLARAKAGAGWLRSGGVTGNGQSRLVVAADTVVDLDGRILGKPSGINEARSMLTALSGREHAVVSGVAIAWDASMSDAPSEPAVLSTVERTAVRFRDLDESDVDWYLQTGEPLDKAGAYAIQDLGALLVERVEGSYLNVVGLPVVALDRLTRQAGWPLHTLGSTQPPDSQHFARRDDVGAAGRG